MDNDLNKISNSDEIDLVDVLGVLIRRRIFLIFSFIILFLISSALMFYKEKSLVNNGNLKLQNQTVCVRCGYDYVVSIENDVLFYIYNILGIDYAKSINNPNFVFEIDFNNFVQNFIFSDSPVKLDFISSTIDSKTFVFFKDEILKNNFLEKYKDFTLILNKALIYRNNLKDLMDYECLDKLNNKDLMFRPSSSCSNYFYYYSFFMNKFSFAVRRNYAPSAFVFNSILQNINLIKINEEDKLLVFEKIKEAKAIEYELNAIKFDISKFIKYLVIMFILSSIISVFTAYIYEFYITNKDRLRAYFK